jgi:hypothetical protein
MRAQVTRQPGQRGTKKLIEQYGEQLVYVRYRYDAARQRRLKTVELIIEGVPWSPPPAPLRKTALVGVRVGFREVELQRRVKQAGGKWNPAKRLWEMRRGQVLKLGLQDRIEVAEGSISSNPHVTTNRTL